MYGPAIASVWKIGVGNGVADLLHYLTGNAQALQNLEGARLQAIRLSRFQGAWLVIKAERVTVGDAVANEQQRDEEATSTGFDHDSSLVKAPGSVGYAARQRSDG
jgi:hypothetical protein